MRAIRTGAVLAILLASVVHAADYCPLKEGNTWMYTMSNGVQMTTKVTGFADVGTTRCAIIETTAGGQTSREYVAADGEGLKTYMAQVQDQQVRYDPPMVRIKLPYKQGDTWTATMNQFGVPVKTTFESVGRERIQTPVGTFDCIKVRANAAGTRPVVSTIYYADGIGPVRQTVQAASQTLIATLAAMNFGFGRSTPNAVTPTTTGGTRCSKCGAEIPAGAKFCPQCGLKVDTPATPTAVAAEPSVPSNPSALERYQSPDGRVLLYKPAGWAVNQGDMYGQGTYAVTVVEPRDNALVLFMTFAANADIRDSVVLAARCIAALRQKYPDLKATSINSTADRVRTLANITLTAEGEKGMGHGYFFRTANAASVYILLAKTALWEQLRPTLTTVAANLAYAPQGVAAVQAQGQQLAAPQTADDQTPTLSPAVMLRRAAQQQGQQVTLVPATLADQSMSLQIPQGWTLTGQRLQYIATISEQTSSHGTCSVYHTILPTDVPVQGALNVRYQSPPVALQTMLEFGKLGTGLQVLASTPTETAVPELAPSIQQQRAQGFQVDSRLMHVRFKNLHTGELTRAIFVVQCSAKAMTPVWQLSVNGGWTPDEEYEQWLPVFLRMGKTATTNQQWFQQEMRHQAATQQRLNQNLQNSIAESNRAFDRYMDSVREGSRSRDYTSHMWSQTTLGQGSWVAEGEGAKVYQTDSWGIEGPEGRIDKPSYNTANFTGQNPWTGQSMELVDTRAEYEKYIANR